MSLHELKSWPENFAAIWDARAKADVRRADRDYRPTDRVHLREWDPERGAYTGRWMEIKITHVTAVGTWELPAHLCVLHYDVIERHIADFAKARYGDTLI
jgi:hypothetical protein